MFKPNGCTGVPELDVRRCCDDHDRLYFYAEMPRDLCDYMFFKCIVSKGEDKGWISKLKYTFIALYYWAGVRLFGGKYYNVH